MKGEGPATTKIYFWPEKTTSFNTVAVSILEKPGAKRSEFMSGAKFAQLRIGMNGCDEERKAALGNVF